MVAVPPEFARPIELEAEMVERRMTAGRTRPILLTARPGNQATSAVECVVKPEVNLTTPPLEYLCEWLASSLARCLGLETPTPHPVRVTREFVDAADESPMKKDLAKSIGLAFGSEYVAGDYTQYVPGMALSNAQQEVAASVLGFDVFVHNPDRRQENPNLFANRSGFLLYDHEQAFSFMFLLPSARDPAIDPAGDIVDGHIFRHAFGPREPDFDRIRSAIAGLDDTALGTIRNGIPEEWTGGSAEGKLDEIMELLGKRRDAVNQWLPQVQAMVGR